MPANVATDRSGRAGQERAPFYLPEIARAVSGKSCLQTGGRGHSRLTTAAHPERRLGPARHRVQANPAVTMFEGG